MKRAALLLCAALLLWGCAARPAASSAPAAPQESGSAAQSSAVEESEPDENAQSSVVLNSTMVFAAHTFGPEFPAHEGSTLVLELTDGAYNSHDSLWERVWSGNFQFRYTGSYGPDEPFPEESEEQNDVVSFPLFLCFNEPFELVVTDYNADGQPDFAIKQFGSFTGGDYCAVFTVGQDGTVAVLPVRTPMARGISAFGTVYPAQGEASEADAFVIPYRHVAPSPELERNAENGFTITYWAIHGLDTGVADLFSEEELAAWYAQKSGSAEAYSPQVNDVYAWRDGAFELIRQELVAEDGSLWRSGT